MLAKFKRAGISEKYIVKVYILFFCIYIQKFHILLLNLKVDFFGRGIRSSTMFWKYFFCFKIKAIQNLLRSKKMDWTLFSREEVIRYPSHWIQNILIIDSWTYWVKGGMVFRKMGIKEGGERVTNVIRIIT